MTRAFRNRMLRDAAIFLGVLIIVLLALSRVLAANTFAFTAFVLIVATAVTFNLRQRRAMKAHRTSSAPR